MYNIASIGLQSQFQLVPRTVCSAANAAAWLQVRWLQKVSNGTDKVDQQSAVKNLLLRLCVQDYMAAQAGMALLYVRMLLADND